MSQVIKLHWIRVLLCGLVTGVLWYLLSAISLALVGRDFVEAVLGTREGRAGTWLFVGVDLAMGVWATWLYVVIRPHYGAGAKTAVIAGFAWWFIKTLQSAKWAGLGFVPLPANSLIGPLLGTLVAAVVATVTGAWLYERRPEHGEPDRISAV